MGRWHVHNRGAARAARRLRRVGRVRSDERRVTHPLDGLGNEDEFRTDHSGRSRRDVVSVL